MLKQHRALRELLQPARAGTNLSHERMLLSLPLGRGAGRLPALIIFTMRFTECLTCQKSSAIRLWHVKSCGKAILEIWKGNNKLSCNWFSMPCIFGSPFVWQSLMILLRVILVGMNLQLNFLLWDLGSRFSSPQCYFFYRALLQPQPQPHPPIHSYSLSLPPVTLLNHITSLIYYLGTQRQQFSASEHDLVGGTKKGCEHEGRGH